MVAPTGWALAGPVTPLLAAMDSTGALVGVAAIGVLAAVLIWRVIAALVALATGALGRAWGGLKILLVIVLAVAGLVGLLLLPV